VPPWPAAGCPSGECQTFQSHAGTWLQPPASLGRSLTAAVGTTTGRVPGTFRSERHTHRGSRSTGPHVSHASRRVTRSHSRLWQNLLKHTGSQPARLVACVQPSCSQPAKQYWALPHDCHTSRFRSLFGRSVCKTMLTCCAASGCCCCCCCDSGGKLALPVAAAACAMCAERLYAACTSNSLL